MIRYNKKCSDYFLGRNCKIGDVVWLPTSSVLSAFSVEHCNITVPLFCSSWEELQESYFDDILRPTRVELDCFKLQTGLDWPFIKENKRKDATQIKKEQHSRYDEKVRQVLEDPDKKTPAKKSKYSV